MGLISQLGKIRGWKSQRGNASSLAGTRNDATSRYKVSQPRYIGTIYASAIYVLPFRVKRLQSARRAITKEHHLDSIPDRDYAQLALLICDAEEPVSYLS